VGRQDYALSFESNGATLSARLHEPPGPLRGCALFAHCFTCGKDLRAARILADRLAGLGIATLRFDFTGLGDSEGELAETSFSSNVEDLVAAATFMRERFEGPAILVGHSLGGAAVLAAAHAIPEVKAVATIGAPADPAHVKKLLTNAEEIEAKGEAEVSIGGRPFRIGKQLLDDLEAQNAPEKIASLKKALLILHSPQDEIVGVENARTIYEAARHPKSFVSLDGAKHLLPKPEDARYVADVLAAWASRYVRPEPHEVERGEVLVEGAHTYQQHVLAGPHGFLADEPRKLGGLDTGPTPYDLLLAALGTCTSMTLRMYADRKEWPLERVRVSLRHERVHAKDCEQCTSTKGQIAVLTRELEIVGDLDEAQRKRLLEIADKCPVHRTLSGEIRIDTELLE